MMESSSGVPDPLRRGLVLGGLFIASAGAARALEPKPVISSAADMPNLEAIVPLQFGEWSLDRSIVPLEISPDVAKNLSTIYDMTLSRTYVNTQGQRVMLSLAYGANQSRALQLHKPEVCYVAQGFKVEGLNPGVLGTLGGSVPVMRLVGRLGARVEPITYWMRVGDDVVRGWFEQNRARLKYGLRGLIPDGLLFRVSNISSDYPAAYDLQARFVGELIAAISANDRHIFVGTVLRSA